jgi:prevent-host-death family protein
METVNALKIRNNLGEILDRLNKTGQPIIVSKGRKVRAVLVTPEDFNRRFLDVQVREEKQKRLRVIKSLRKKKTDAIDSTLLLRQLRGYIK